MIQQFLTNNLIQISEDGNVDKLQKASTSLEKKLLKSKSKIIAFTLIALDPEIPVSDPNVQEVQQLIIDNWKTFTSNCKDTPLTYIRAVILEALNTMSKDINIANQIWLTGRNIQKYYKLVGKERELIINFLTNIGNEIEEDAAKTWAIHLDYKFQELSIEIKTITGVSIDKVELQNHLKAASIHSGLGDGGENPQYPSHNAAIWPNFFSDRASRGIAEIINKALKKQTDEINIIQNKIQEVIDKIFKQTFEQTIQRNKILEMRTQLLWWKESCYSPSIKDSYRGQPIGLLQLIMAKDYVSFVPCIFPSSVDYFLKETHRGIVDKDEILTFSKILKQIDTSKDILKSIIKESTYDVERVSLFHFISGYIWDKFTMNQFKVVVGLSETIEISLSDFILWLFHDLQVLNSINSK
ncbi:MAG: GTPase-associated system all-helical protein GASH [Paludibacter sp.]|nr:GTPase-associated system all-helical protein GASH [Paludibacter sp.]